jgi:hypothetical protein
MHGFPNFSGQVEPHDELRIAFQDIILEVFPAFAREKKHVIKTNCFLTDYLKEVGEKTPFCPRSLTNNVKRVAVNDGRVRRTPGRKKRAGDLPLPGPVLLLLRTVGPLEARRADARHSLNVASALV